MLSLILVLIAGSALVYISKFNFMPVTVNVGMYTISDIPLFYVMVASLLTGLLLAYILYLANVISTTLVMRSKDKEIKENKLEVLELTKRVHQLELENIKIKNGATTEIVDPNAL